MQGKTSHEEPFGRFYETQKYPLRNFPHFCNFTYSRGRSGNSAIRVNTTILHIGEIFDKRRVASQSPFQGRGRAEERSNSMPSAIQQDEYTVAVDRLIRLTRRRSGWKRIGGELSWKLGATAFVLAVGAAMTFLLMQFCGWLGTGSFTAWIVAVIAGGYLVLLGLAMAVILFLVIRAIWQTGD